MIYFFEKIILVFGIYVNFHLVLNILIRPILWSTTNTFIGCLLTSNLLYLSFQALLDESYMNINQGDDIVIQYLEQSFSDHYTTIICSAKFLSQFIHGTLTITILVGIIFIRSMMVKYADNIRTNNFECKSHQARLSFIGVLVAVFIFTSCTGIIITFFLHPLSISEFVLVRNCRGVTIIYETVRYGDWLPVSVIIVLLGVATISCQVRIIKYRRRHNNSYFSQFRQNIATMDQLSAAAYLTLLLSLFQEAIILTIVSNFYRTLNYEIFMKTRILLSCIFIPCYWFYSSRKGFQEFWTMKTYFGKRNVSPHHSFKVAGVTLEPRRPEFEETVFTNEVDKSKKETDIQRRFTYGLKVCKPLKQAKM